MLLMLCEEFLDELRAEARSNFLVAVCTQALTPTLSHRERESNCITTQSPNWDSTIQAPVAVPALRMWLMQTRSVVANIISITKKT